MDIYRNGKLGFFFCLRERNQFVVIPVKQFLYNIVKFVKKGSINNVALQYNVAYGNVDVWILYNLVVRLHIFIGRIYSRFV